MNELRTGKWDLNLRSRPWSPRVPYGHEFATRKISTTPRWRRKKLPTDPDVLSSNLSLQRGFADTSSAHRHVKATLALVETMSSTGQILGTILYLFQSASITRA